MLASRESHRIVGEYVLREQDVQTQVSQTPHPDVVTIADHHLDTHGAGGGLGQAAGLAAAETARTGTEVMAVDLPGIQAELNLPLE